MPEHQHGLGQYRTVDAYGAAAAGDRVALISRLMQSAVDRIVTARGHLVRRELAAKGENLTRAVAMIDGLRVALDHSRGGDLAGNLERLYDYMVRRLTEGNLRNDPRLLDEVVDLLNEIRGGWDEAARTVQLKPVATTANPATTGSTA